MMEVHRGEGLADQERGSSWEWGRERRGRPRNAANVGGCRRTR